MGACQLKRSTRFIPVSRQPSSPGRVKNERSPPPCPASPLRSIRSQASQRAANARYTSAVTAKRAYSRRCNQRQKNGNAKSACGNGLCRPRATPPNRAAARMLARSSRSTSQVQARFASRCAGIVYCEPDVTRNCADVVSASAAIMGAERSSGRSVLASALTRSTLAPAHSGLSHAARCSVWNAASAAA